MNNSFNLFTKFVNISLKILLIPVLIGCFKLLTNYIKYTDLIFPLFSVLFTGICFYALDRTIKKDYSHRSILLVITVLALILRIAYALSIKNQPVSDFRIIFETAELVLNGNYDNFKGSGYIARFPHLTIFTLYYALMRYIFDYPLIAIKIVNCFFSSINVLLVYFISKECFQSSRKSLWASMSIALFPPLVVYPAAYNTENIAIPFFLASIYAFVLVANNKVPAKGLLLCGFFLTIGNMFRMVGQVMIIAYIMFVLIYLRRTLMEKIKNITYILGSFIIPLVLISNLLIAAGITEFQLWSGSEPFWTSILKGTNMESNGRWNEEDAIIPNKYDYDYDKITEASKKIIKQRLSSASPEQLVKFYLHKFTFQWREGDFSASYWAEADTEPQHMMISLQNKNPAYAQLYFFILMVFAYIGLYNKQHYLKNSIVNLFYIIFCGYALFYLITESQDRYSFIVCWLFPILALTPRWELLNKRNLLKDSNPFLPIENSKEI